MLKSIYHVGLTVSDLDRSVAFYRDVLHLAYAGELLMEGEETDLLFGRKNCRARVAYLHPQGALEMPPVELIQFLDEPAKQETPSLFSTSISELCFLTQDAEAVYEGLCKAGVPCLSAPRQFDFTSDGFGKSKAFYFRDPDGILLEIMEPLAD